MKLTPGVDFTKSFKIVFETPKYFGVYYFGVCRGQLAQWLSVHFVKFVLQGTAVRISPKDFTFQSRIYFAKRIDGNLQLSDVLHRISQPIEQTAVATISTSEEERSLGNWSYDVNILGSGMTSYTLLRNST